MAVRPPTPKKPVFKVSSCECADCRAACLNSPGWFQPAEVPRLAKHLGLTVEETFRRYLAVGVTHTTDGSPRHGVMPHKLRDHKKPGGVWTLPELADPGRCIFFDHGKCTIYGVRPYECARMIHGRENEAVKLRRTIVKNWTAEALAPFAKLTKTRLTGAPPPLGSRRPGSAPARATGGKKPPAKPKGSS
jgi:Fe-S-cluster containining protein